MRSTSWANPSSAVQSKLATSCDFLEALADPANPEHEDLKEWVGGSFDPVAFDVADVNERLNPSNC